MVERIVDKALDGRKLSADEIAALFGVALFSPGYARIVAAARQMSEQACQGLAEVHGQVGLNIAPCPGDCLFCSFAGCNGVFTRSSELEADEVVARALEFERDGANAVYLMSTVQYPFGRVLEMAQEVRRHLSPEIPLAGNLPDFGATQARRLKDAGFAGIYHAVRLGEGRDTIFDPQQRLATVRAAREEGLIVGTCVEPVGVEHGVDELVEKTLLTRDMAPGFSGSARRIPIPGTEMARRGIVSKARMALILAVVRLGVGHDVPGNCTHEPDVHGAACGASLLWAEAGSNPRDVEEQTERRRGTTVQQCRAMFREAGWKVLSGPSQYYAHERYRTDLLAVEESTVIPVIS